jgi:hypothetical protein
MADLERLQQSRQMQEQRGFTERDFNREQTKIKELGLESSQITPDVEKDLFEATYSPEELSGLSDYKSLVKGQAQIAGQAKTALGEAQEAFTGFRPEQKLGILEEALRDKTDVGAQRLGTSELFERAGIPTEGAQAFATLSQSLNQRGQEMADRYGSFVNVLDKAGRLVGEENRRLANNYKFAIDQYNSEIGRLDKMMDNIVRHEQGLELAEREIDLFKEKERFKSGLPPTIGEQLAAEEAGKVIRDGKLVTIGSLEDIKDRAGSSLVGDYQRLFLGSPLNKEGLDLAGAPNSPITASVGGTVVEMKDHPEWGKTIVVEDSEGNKHRYSHLNGFTGTLSVGTSVEAGQQIGLMGNTGKVLGEGRETLTAEQIQQGRGTHLDYTVTKPDGTRYSVQENASFAGLGQGEKELSKLALAVIDNPSLLGNYTNTEKGKVLTELAEKGIELKNVATPEQIKLLNALNDDVRSEPLYKQVVQIQNGFQNVNTGAEINNAQGDLSIVNGYAKMLDPTGVVRPAEFDTVEEAQGFFQRMKVAPRKFLKGDRLHPDARKSFQDAARTLYSEKVESYNSLIDNKYVPTAEFSGIPLDLVENLKVPPAEDIIKEEPVEFAGGRDEAVKLLEDNNYPVTEANIQYILKQ